MTAEAANAVPVRRGMSVSSQGFSSPIGASAGGNRQDPFARPSLQGGAAFAPTPRAPTHSRHTRAATTRAPITRAATWRRRHASPLPRAPDRPAWRISRARRRAAPAGAAHRRRGARPAPLADIIRSMERATQSIRTLSPSRTSAIGPADRSLRAHVADHHARASRRRNGHR